VAVAKLDASLNAEIQALPSGSPRRQQLEEKRTANFKARHGTAEDEEGRTQSAATTADPALAAAVDGLRGMKPYSDEWVATVKEIDAKVLAQPLRADDVAGMRQAAEGIPLDGGRTWDAQELARSVNIARFNLGPAEAERAVVAGMAAVRRALADADRGILYPTWADGVDEIAEWDDEREATRRVEDIHQAWSKMPPAARAAITKAGIKYHPALLRHLAAVGAKMPLLGPEA